MSPITALFLGTFLAVSPPLAANPMDTTERTALRVDVPAGTSAAREPSTTYPAGFNFCVLFEGFLSNSC